MHFCNPFTVHFMHFANGAIMREFLWTLDTTCHNMDWTWEHSYKKWVSSNKITPKKPSLLLFEKLDEIQILMFVSRFLRFHWFWKWNTLIICVWQDQRARETYYLVFPNLIDYDIGVTLFTCCLRPDSVDCDQSRIRIFSECFRMNEEYIIERKGDFVENNNPISSS